MKKLIVSLILIACGIVFSIGMMAQGPTPPLDPNAGGNQLPGNAPTGVPIDPGTGIFLILAAGYGFKKVQNVRKIPNN